MVRAACPLLIGPCPVPNSFTLEACGDGGQACQADLGCPGWRSGSGDQAWIWQQAGWLRDAIPIPLDVRKTMSLDSLARTLVQYNSLRRFALALVARYLFVIAVKSHVARLNSHRGLW